MSIIDSMLAATLRRRQERMEAREREESPPSPDDILNPRESENDPDLDTGGDPAIPPTHGRRRQRADSTPQERLAKYARLTESACNNYKLSGKYRTEVQDFSTVRTFCFAEQGQADD